jgi:hypothetical protein
LSDRERELDACSQAIYGSSHAEFCDKLFKYAFDRGYEQGWQEGRTAGRRAAKGLKTPAKKRGRQLEIDESEIPLLIDAVKKRKQRGQTIKETVNYFLHVMQAGERRLADPDRPPRKAITPASVNKAVWAFYRHRPRKGPA